MATTTNNGDKKMKTTTITSNERKMITAIAEADIRSDKNDLQTPVWTEYATEGFGKSAGGIMASLTKKGLAWTTGYTSDDTCGLTEKGAEAYKTMKAKIDGLNEYDEFRQQYYRGEITWEKLSEKTKEYEWVFELSM
jgi:hypothetical protein